MSYPKNKNTYFDEGVRCSSQEGDGRSEKSGATIDLSLLLLLSIPAAEPLEAGLEGSTDIAIDQQVNHNDDRNNPATDHGEC